MADDKINLVLAHPYDGKAPGAKLSLDRAEALQLIEAGYASVSTEAEAKAAGLDPETTPTAKK